MQVQADLIKPLYLFGFAVLEELPSISARVGLLDGDAERAYCWR
jgi:hypothetical protein